MYTALESHRNSVRNMIYAPEQQTVQDLIPYAMLSASEQNAVQQKATDFVKMVRGQNPDHIDALMAEYDLSTKEGITLMCLAESLLRIPDTHTQDMLIQDKICGQHWQDHIDTTKSMFVNASTWGLIITGKLLNTDQAEYRRSAPVTLKNVTRRLSEPVVRQCIRQGMHMMGRQFVIGETITNAYKKAHKNAEIGYNHSFDMLGEAARTQGDALKYMQAYKDALHAVGKKNKTTDLLSSDGISVKLSALHPRYEYTHMQVVLNALYPRLLKLCEIACTYNIGLCIDAEESERLDISMTILERLSAEKSLGDWQGLGLAVQAYQKRAFIYVDWLAELAKTYNRRLMVRLVKGAYWDTEIKRSQTLNTEDFPVFTRKEYTDVSYIACAKKVLQYNDVIYPCFATHNAHTVATILTLSNNKQYEFQCLHGMGGILHDTLVKNGHAVRIYAPVGGYKDLLAYLVRRLLENGANSNFVNRITNADMPIADIIADPVVMSQSHNGTPHPTIIHPSNICGENRLNSVGVDIADVKQVVPLLQNIQTQVFPTQVTSIIDGNNITSSHITDDICPATGKSIATIHWADTQQVKLAIDSAGKAFKGWNNTPVADRARALYTTADALEHHMAEFLYLLQTESGKTLADAVAEIREAVDFLRYYAQHGQNELLPKSLPGPTGEENTLYTHGRGVFVCISPWNFPLAIFMGQISAGLVTGNTVVAKPADSTCAIAYRAVQIMHQAGVPTDVLHLLLTDGPTLGNVAFPHKALGGVCFTGSTAVANTIQHALANRTYGIVPFIAETGGQNALITDSSALPEQVCDDVIMGAFQSAGQRCSALRVLFVQDDIAKPMLNMIIGAMQQLHIGDNTHLDTDVGPIITDTALNTLNAHKQWLRDTAKILYENPMPKGVTGTFCTPVLAEIPSIDVLEKEVFGPILHVVRYNAQNLDAVINSINNTGYGLTLGIHSRIDTTVEKIAHSVRVGNVYINRNQIGAIVGVQPFGGNGLSGTGPKAGGPLYLSRFVTEKTISNNISAAGGNAHLMAQM